MGELPLKTNCYDFSKDLQMTRNEIQKCFLAVSAACIIALGSGFTTFGEYMFERDKEAAKAEIDFENSYGVNLIKSTDCSTLVSGKADCEYALYLRSSDEGLMGMFRFIADVIVIVGSVCLGGAVLIQVKQKKS